jgi:hypothetical protein
MQRTKSAVTISLSTLLFLLGCCCNHFHSTAAFSFHSGITKATSSVRASLTLSSLGVSTSDNSSVEATATTVPDVADMQRGIGGRIEDAFESAKERGEAAFVTFVTAGYPRSQGEWLLSETR